MVKKTRKLGESNRRLMFRSRSYNNSPQRPAFTMANRRSLENKMKRGNRITPIQSRDLYNNNTLLDNRDYVQELKYERQFGKPVNLNLVNRQILMSSSLNDIMLYLNNKQKRMLNSLVNSVLNNQKNKIKKMYRSKKLSNNNYQAIKSFIN